MKIISSFAQIHKKTMVLNLMLLTVVIPPYGSMGGYLVYCVFFLFFLFYCTVTDFSVVEKARDMKFCMRVGLLSGQVFSPFGEDWLAGSHGGGGITSP